jgi:hypothetical protein
MPLSEHNNVVKAFPSDRTDQPFGTSILPRGAWRRWSVANAHRSKSSDEDIAIGSIAIADQIVGSPFPAESFRNLICNPFCGRMRCDGEPYDLSSAVPHDQQSIEQTKRDCRHDEQIHRGDAVGMIAKERLPTLRRRFSSPDHVLGHAGLSDTDAELESSPWIRGAPHSGLAMLISWISLRMSGGTVGRPPRRLDFQRQYALKPARCQRMIVSGLTIANASQALGNSRYRPTNINRSKIPKDCLLGAARRKTLICCLSTQISASSVARARIRSTSVQKISLQRSVITRLHQPIRLCSPTGFSLR